MALPQNVRDACQFFLDNPSYFNMADAADDKDGRPDGKVSPGDLRKYVANVAGVARDVPEVPANQKDAAKVLMAHLFVLDTASGGKRDNRFNKADLTAIIASPGAPAQLRNACQFFLDNPIYFNALDVANDKDGVTDGEVSYGDLKRFIEGV
jgi:hypothetical protein